MGIIVSLSNGFITPQVALAYGTHTALLSCACVGLFSLIFVSMYLNLSRKVEKERLVLERESIFQE